MMSWLMTKTDGVAEPAVLLRERAGHRDRRPAVLRLPGDVGNGNRDRDQST